MNREHDLILSLLQETRWQVVEKIIQGLLDKWNAERCKGDTEFDTVWKLAYREGKVAGLEELKNVLEQIASND